MYGCVPLNVSVPKGEDSNALNVDIFEELYRERIIYISQPITDESATKIVAKLLTLAMEAPNDDISIYIDTYGTDISAVMSIINTIEILPCKVHTICVSSASGMAALLLASGSAGCRVAFQHAWIHIAQFREVLSGKQSDLTVDYEKFVQDREKIRKVLSNATGKSLGEVATMMSPGVCHMNVATAKEFGIIDEIFSR